MKKSLTAKYVLLVWIASLMVLPVRAQKKSSESLSLPVPYATKSTRGFSKVIGWSNSKAPSAPNGFKVSAYASGLENPRWLYGLPNGDLLVAETNGRHGFLEKIGAHIIGASHSNNLHKSANRITLLRDSDQDGSVDLTTTFLSDLNQPFGMLVLDKWFYVANTDAVWRYPYTTGQTTITGTGQKLVDLPGGKRHWTRNIVANAAGTKIYIAVGSASNVAEDGIDKELLRADILEMSPDGRDLKVYASGLRNPVGMGWSSDGSLWTVVNERDELGDNLVPDYVTHVQPGGFYGWPYVYLGQHPDPRIKEKRFEPAHTAIVPDLLLGPHTASLGLAFYNEKFYPQKYHHGVFIAQHGSWNRSTLSGYKVIFIPFANGKPSGDPEDFLTGFIADLSKRKVHGRPVGLAVMPDGSLMVADDVSKVLWRVGVENKAVPIGEKSSKRTN